MNIQLFLLLWVLILPRITSCVAAGKDSNGKGNQVKSLDGACSQNSCSCSPGIPGIPGSPGPAGPAGVAGPPGTRGTAGDKGEKGFPGSSGREGSQGIKGDAGDKGSLGAPGPHGLPGTLESNWKQCVFKDLGDGRDTGLIKECLFNKLSNETGLRVFWNGALRIYNCHACCRRWYFTFNGAECSIPAAIDGIVYMVNGHGPNKDLHRVRQIEGVCEEVPRGIVRVGFWVGNCRGYGNADAHTGWNSVSRIYVEEVPAPQA